MKIIAAFLGAGLLVAADAFSAQAADLPARDQRLREPATLNTPRAFPPIATKAEWQTRSRAIRTQILVSAGLWPMPEKAPLNAKIFGRTEHGDFSVEKVHIQTFPGFYLGGNLYRPLGKGKGPFPGVLNPHGHWSKGRLEDGKDGSIPARCISQARMGMVAFAIDMVGYNDTQFADATKEPGYNYHRRFGTNATDLLWNINLMGLQTWNSIRALDFLCSLPDVDEKHIGCTGASGGGTQTFMLGAIDDRLDVLAPTVMVSHTMQGGCSCENMPGLRVEYSNMEIAAVPVPKPQIFVAATGDWTKAFMTVEGPAIAGIYKLFGAEERVTYKVLNFGHNYNQTTREEVYAFFNAHLLRQDEPYKEQAYPAATNLNLRVFPNGERPGDTLSIKGLTEQMTKQAAAQLNALKPIGPASHKRFCELMLPAWQHTLQAELKPQVITQSAQTSTVGNVKKTVLFIGRPGRGDRLPVVLLASNIRAPKAIAVLAHPAGRAGFLDAAGQPKDLALELLNRKCHVVLLDTFMTGELHDYEVAKKRARQADLFFPTYNRTDAQERVQDLITACAFARKEAAAPVVLCGSGVAGIWALLAAPAADAVAADTARLMSENDQTLLMPEIFVPGVRRIGGVEGAALLAAPHPLLLHNTSGHFHQAPLQALYTGYRRSPAFQHHLQSLGAPQLADWIASVGK